MLPQTVYAPTETVRGEFNTFDSTGAPVTLAGSPSLRLKRIRSGTTTGITGAGITLTVGTAAQATGVLTLAANVADGDTVTIGSKTYTFQTTLTDVDGNVLIGASASDSIDNLVAAINLAAGAGTTYAASMTEHPDVGAAAGAGDTMDVTADIAGEAGNDIATTDVSANASWGAATLTGGSDARHAYAIDLDDANILAADQDEYSVVIGAGTVDGISVVGVVIDRFVVRADGLTTQQKADVQTEAAAALTAYDPPTRAEATADKAEILATPPLGTAMRGTDGAALATVATEARLAELDAANLPADVDTVKAAATEARLAELDAANLPADLDTVKAAATEARLAELDPANLPADIEAILVDTGTDIPATLATIAGYIDTEIQEILARLPAETVDGLTPTQLWATVLASCAGRIVDASANPVVIQNPDGTQTRISASTERGTVTLSFTGV